MWETRSSHRCQEIKCDETKQLHKNMMWCRRLNAAKWKLVKRNHKTEQLQLQKQAHKLIRHLYAVNKEGRQSYFQCHIPPVRAVSTLVSTALQVWDCFSIIAAWGLRSDHRARLLLRATQGRKCFPWQMHVELPLERITATISVTPSLISELIGLLSNGREGQRYARHYGKKMSWMYMEYGVKNIPFNLGIYNG